jgi:hypothetical protein
LVEGCNKGNGATSNFESTFFGKEECTNFGKVKCTFKPKIPKVSIDFVIAGIYKTRARQSGAEGPGRPIGVKRGRIFWLIFHAHMPCTALEAGSACPHFVNPELFRGQLVLARTIFLFDKYGPDRDKFYTTYSTKGSKRCRFDQEF